MVDNPARDFPMNRDGHPRSVAPRYEIEKYRFTWNVKAGKTTESAWLQVPLVAIAQAITATI